MKAVDSGPSERMDGEPLLLGVGDHDDDMENLSTSVSNTQTEKFIIIAPLPLDEDIDVMKQNYEADENEICWSNGQGSELMLNKYPDLSLGRRICEKGQSWEEELIQVTEGKQNGCNQRTPEMQTVDVQLEPKVVDADSEMNGGDMQPSLLIKKVTGGSMKEEIDMHPCVPQRPDVIPVERRTDEKSVSILASGVESSGQETSLSSGDGAELEVPTVPESGHCREESSETDHPISGGCRQLIEKGSVNEKCTQAVVMSTEKVVSIGEMDNHGVSDKIIEQVLVLGEKGSMDDFVHGNVGIKSCEYSTKHCAEKSARMNEPLVERCEESFGKGSNMEVTLNDREGHLANENVDMEVTSSHMGEQNHQKPSEMNGFGDLMGVDCAEKGLTMDNFTDFMSVTVKTECVNDDPDAPYGGQAQLMCPFYLVDQIKQEPEEVVPTITPPAIAVTEIPAKRRRGRKPKVKLRFTCVVCEERFSSASGLRSHMYTHTREKHFVCDVCQESFIHSHQLKTHKESHNMQRKTKSIQRNTKSVQKDTKFVQKNTRSVQKKTTSVQSITKSVSISKPQSRTAKSVTGRHTCQKCQKQFRTSVMLEKHMKRIHKETKFECDACETTFKTSTRFKGHTCKKSVYFECGVCEQMFASREELKEHVANHPDVSEELKYECGVCKMVFRKSRGLKIHMKVHNESNKNYHCLECDKTFSHYKSLLSHQEVAHEEKHKCPICPKEFKDRSLLKKHMRTHSDGLKCEECNEKFSRAIDLRLHSRVHRKWKCKKCGEEFESRDELRSHKLIHVKRYDCVVCDFSSITSAILQVHLKTHIQTEYKCKVCEETFTRATSLYQHNLSHTNIRKYTCELCGSSFTQSSTLVAHRRVHTGERPFPCGICEKAFIEKSALRSHMITHSAEKKHHCDVCGKSFPHKCSLVRHMRIHTSDKPFKCPECVKSFGQSNQLKIHIRCHTGEKPYKCEDCGVRFAYVETLRSHMRIHGVADITCDRCDKTFSNKFHLKRHYKLHTGEVNFICDVCGQGFGRKDYLKKHILSHE